VLEDRVLDERGRFVAQFDLAFPDRRVAVELDSVRWHHDLAGFERDRARVRKLATVDWTVLPLTWKQHVGEPQAFIRQLTAVLRRTLG
jgi:very-short-patch-repair endonuclease